MGDGFIGKFVFVTTLLIMTVVVVSVFNASMTPARDAGDDLRNEPCIDAGGVWNTTNHICQNVSTGASGEITNFTHYGLSASFYGRNGGAAFIIILAGLLLSLFFVWRATMR